jgi:NAD-dependent dihydropyrimidine dehydrogenase PreA subunit
MKTRYLKNVVKIRILEEKCTGCGMCIDVCPHAVIAISGRKAFLSDRDACMECGACAKNCPFEAIDVKAGVGCAAAVITGFLRGTEPDCSCSGTDGTGCC